MNEATFVRPMLMKERFRAALSLYRLNLGNFVLIYSGLVLLVLIVGGLNYWISDGLKNGMVPVFLFDLLFLPGILILNATSVIGTSNAVLHRPVRIGQSFQRALSPQVLLCILLSILPMAIWGLIYYTASDYLKVTPIIFLPGASIRVVSSFLLSILLDLVNSAITFCYYILIFFVPVVSILERQSVSRRMARAISLVFKNFGRVVAHYVLAGLFALVGLAVLFGCFLAGFGGFLFLTDPGALFNDAQPFTTGEDIVLYVCFAIILILFILIFVPLTNLIVLLLYYDIRSRKEKYDEVVLAEEMGYRPMPEMILT